MIERTSHETANTVAAALLDMCKTLGTDTDKAILRGAATALLNLHEERKELRDALTEVMTWIGNWDPNFTQDAEWPETRARIDRALGNKEKP